MSHTTLAWAVIALYALVTLALAFRGFFQTQNLRSFTLGSGEISPVVVGLSLAAQLASVATFVINPGLIYAFGIPALLAIGVATSSGIILGLTILSPSFRRIGANAAAMTLPGWLGSRFQSDRLRVAMGLVSMLLVTFVVMIVVGIGYVLEGLVGVPALSGAAGTIVFVFGYVLLGGANTSSYTNAAQALIMLLVAIILVASGLPLLAEGPAAFLAKLQAADPNLVGWTNPASPYFRTLPEVLLANFLVGIAIVCQPHIVTKALAVKSDEDLWTYLKTGIAVATTFAAVLVVGLYARVTLPPVAQIDRVVPTYVTATFPPLVQLVVSIGLLAAGLSTLEGLLLALSAILAGDLFLPLVRIFRGEGDAGARARAAMRVARLGLAAIGVVTYQLAAQQITDPTGGSVAIFAQLGVYCVFSAAFAPMLFGIFLEDVSARLAGAGAATAVATYLGLWACQVTRFSNNPAVLSASALVASAAVMAAGLAWARARRPASASLAVPAAA